MLVERHFSSQLSANERRVFNPQRFYVVDEDTQAPLNVTTTSASTDDHEPDLECGAVNERLCEIADRIYATVLSENRKASRFKKKNLINSQAPSAYSLPKARP